MYSAHALVPSSKDVLPGMEVELVAGAAMPSEKAPMAMAAGGSVAGLVEVAWEAMGKAPTLVAVALVEEQQAVDTTTVAVAAG